MDFMTTKELAELLRIPAGSLNNWRTRGGGPPFLKFGQRVLYPREEVMKFIKENVHENTAQARKKK